MKLLLNFIWNIFWVIAFTFSMHRFWEKDVWYGYIAAVLCFIGAAYHLYKIDTDLKITNDTTKTE